MLPSRINPGYTASPQLLAAKLSTSSSSGLKKKLSSKPRALVIGYLMIAISLIASSAITQAAEQDVPRECPMDLVVSFPERDKAKCSDCDAIAYQVRSHNVIVLAHEAELGEAIRRYNELCGMEAPCSGEQDSECNDGKKVELFTVYTGNAAGGFKGKELKAIPSYERFEDFDDLIDLIDGSIRRPIDRNGVCRDCLDYLQIVQHGSSSNDPTPGEYRIGEIVVDADNVDIPKKSFKIDDSRLNGLLRSLRRINPYLCTTANVAFSQCNVAIGKKGAVAGGALANLFGAYVVAPDFTCRVGFTYDYPTARDPAGHWYGPGKNYRVFGPSHPIKTSCEVLNELHQERLNAAYNKVMGLKQKHERHSKILKALFAKLEQCENNNCTNASSSPDEKIQIGSPESEAKETSTRFAFIGRNREIGEKLIVTFAVGANCADPKCRLMAVEINTWIDQAMDDISAENDKTLEILESQVEANSITEAEKIQRLETATAVRDNDFVIELKRRRAELDLCCHYSKKGDDHAVAPDETPLEEDYVEQNEALMSGAEDGVLTTGSGEGEGEGEGTKLTDIPAVEEVDDHAVAPDETPDEIDVTGTRVRTLGASEGPTRPVSLNPPPIILDEDDIETNEALMSGAEDSVLTTGSGEGAGTKPTGITVAVADVFGINGLTVVPAPGIVVRVIDDNGREVASATTDNAFATDFIELRPGTYQLRLDIGKYKAALPAHCTEGYVRQIVVTDGQHTKYTASVYSAVESRDGKSVGTVSGECIKQQ